MKTESLAAELARAEFQRAGTNQSPAYQLALHTRRPEGEDQAEAEIDLRGYTRVAAPRDASTWTVEGRAAMNAVLIRFPTITAGRGKATWLSLGIGGRIRRLIELKEPVSLALNRRVEFEPGAIRIEEAQSDVPA